jgi:hypothetical protein
MNARNHEVRQPRDGPESRPAAEQPLPFESVDGVDPLSSSALSALRKMMHVNRQMLGILAGNTAAALTPPDEPAGWA